MRVILNPRLGGEIDGGWWPRSAPLAQELPGLIEALHPTLGEIVDIKLNWSALAGTPIRKPLSAATMSMTAWNDTRQRLMFITGRTASVRLLVVPHSVTATLGRFVMRRAASLPIFDAEQGSAMLETADCVVRAAKRESSLWTARMAVDDAAVSTV